MVRTFICSCCRRTVRANPRVKNQHYCGRAACQRERKRRWQQAKLATDEDYRANQREAVRNWRERHPDYWRKRKKPPPQPRERVHPVQVNMDASGRFFHVDTGEYILCPAKGSKVNMDTLRVKIIALTGG